MAPERTGQSTIPVTRVIVKEEYSEDNPKKTNSILEDFLEIKIKEELDYQEGRRRRRDEDQDLTSLSWLQSNNLLKSKPLKLPESSAAAVAAAKSALKVKTELHHLEESPISELTEETFSESSNTNHSLNSNCSSIHAGNTRLGGASVIFNYSPSSTVVMDGPSISYDEDGETHGETIQGIGTHRYFGVSSSGSVSSATSNVGNSNARQFVNNKEKHLYSVPYDPHFHTNSKPPYSFSCLIFMAIEDSHARALPVKEIYSWITDHFPYFNKAPTGWKNSVRHNLSLNKCFRKVDKAPNLGKGSLWIVDPQYRPNLLNALAKAPYHPCASLDRPAKPPILPPVIVTPQQNDVAQPKNQSRLPPDLFPYLSKRLAASEGDRMEETDEGSEVDSLDDVDAATAMLELKHGPPRPKMWRKKARVEGELLISTSPSEDHTYTSFNSGTSSVVVTVPGTGASASNSSRFSHGNTLSVMKTTSRAIDTISNDDLYGAETDDDTCEKSPFRDENEESWSSDGAEQRNVASALLNLAGGTRKRGHQGQATSLNRSPPTRATKRSTRGQRGARRGVVNSSRERNEILNNNSEKVSSSSSSSSAASASLPRSRHHGHDQQLLYSGR